MTNLIFTALMLASLASSIEAKTELTLAQYPKDDSTPTLPQAPTLPTKVTTQPYYRPVMLSPTIQMGYAPTGGACTTRG